MSGKKRRRGISLGTIVMLALTVFVCVGMGAVLQQLTNGTQVSIDTGKMLGALNLSDALPELSLNEIPITITQTGSGAAPAPSQSAPEVSAWPVSTKGASAALTATQTPVPAPTPVPRGGTFSLTVGGSVCVEEGVRQSGYYKDAKTYDFTEIFSLIGREFDSDVNLVTLENLVIPDSKVSDLIAPTAVLNMLSINGIDTVACGFSKAFDKKFDGLASTVALAKEQLRVIGAYGSENDAALGERIMVVGGVKVALLHYTDNLSSNAVKALNKDGRTWALPQSAAIAGDIARVRDAGAEVVIVSINWGSVGKTAPTKAQKALAQTIADAGADVLLGAGSRVVQPAEWLTGTLLDGSKHAMLCLYSLGTLISDNRKDAQVAGMLAKLTIQVAGDGTVNFLRTDYIPTYVWRFKQDSLYSYRVVAADLPAPDGMEASQQKSLLNAQSTILKTLSTTPLAPRTVQ